MTIIRVKYAQRGKHVHCNLFTSQGSNLTFALCGTLVFNLQEFDDIRAEYPEWDWLNSEAAA